MPNKTLAQQWQLVRNEQQVQVFKLVLTGQPDRFMVQTQVLAPPLALLNLLQDLKNNPNWVEGSLGVSLIKQLSANENLVRTRLKAPWPFKNRDIVNYSRYWQDQRNCALFVDIQAKPEAIKTDPDYERVSDFQANWSAYPTSSSTSLIRYTGWLDPGGFIPQFMAAPIAVNSLFITFVNMRQQILKPKYQATKGLTGFSPCQTRHFYKNKSGS